MRTVAGGEVTEVARGPRSRRPSGILRTLAFTLGGGGGVLLEGVRQRRNMPDFHFERILTATARRLLKGQSD